jgi:superfamily II DNA or RNA helicase
MAFFHNPTRKTYLGGKGYTLNKEDLSAEEAAFIKKELTVRPYVPGSPANNTTVSFPAFRESPNKFYLPRHFGEKHFGPAQSTKIPEGDDIDVAFCGELREHQHAPVNAYLNLVQRNGFSGGTGLLDLPCAFGKTSLSLHICSQLKKKTLVLVHKEFLFNQWIERIQQFLPSAKVGKIQGPVIDIQGKDIVLGMIQSISMKEYPATVFESFGLVIIDEVHHIASEVFSNTLFKLVTKYMLGLSATMTRKDGTTKVFKMFLGDVVYKHAKKKEHDVTVRAIEYKVNDDEFNEVKYDYRGNPAFSTMISKLCAYNRRSEFILKVLSDMLLENPNQQVMILAHNKNLLKYFFDAISTREIASVGYYVGGMKEAALKISETKKVIIATYAMAAEGLDIKTLTTLIMATPKTDIEQSVGRILREKHSQPIVVDIVDSHEPFKKQWAKRKTFYKKQEYKILYTDSVNYKPLGNVNETACAVSYWTDLTTSKRGSSNSECASDDDTCEIEGSCADKKDNMLQGKCFLLGKLKK